jgi:hypothetical protein
MVCGDFKKTPSEPYLYDGAFKSSKNTRKHASKR